MVSYSLHFDGSCWPNPGGTAGYGYVISKTGQEEPVDFHHGVVATGPKMSNNVAEFFALNCGLAAFRSKVIGFGAFPPIYTLDVFGDSNLVVKVMTGHFKAKADKLYYPYYLTALDVLKDIRRGHHKISFNWIPRELNDKCDRLSKAHLKEKTNA